MDPAELVKNYKGFHQPFMRMRHNYFVRNNPLLDQDARDFIITRNPKFKDKWK